MRLAVICAILFASMMSFAAESFGADAKPGAPVTNTPASPSGQGELQMVNPPSIIVEYNPKGRLLSVKLNNAELPRVLSEIAAKANFKAAVTPDLNSLLVTTTFSGVEIERAIHRILGLLKLKDFSFSYNPDGSLSRVEVISVTTRPAQATTKPKTPPRPKGITRVPPKPADELLAPDQMHFEEQTEEPELPEAPFMPPASAPVYIPPPMKR